MKIIGIEFRDQQIRLATLTKKRGKIVISSLIETTDVKQLDMDNGKKRIISGLDMSDLLLKNEIIHLQKKKDLRKTLLFQMQTLTSLPSEETLFFPKILKKDKSGFHLLFFITTKESLRKHLSSLPIDPDETSAYPIALTRFAHYLFPDLSTLFILHVEKKSLLLLLMEEGHPVAASSFPLELHFSSEKDAFLLFQQRMEKYFASLLQNRSIKIPLLLTGDEILLSQIESKWQSSVFVSHLLYSPSEKKKKFALSIGLALDALSKDPLSFRQKEFISSKQLKMYGKKISLFFFSLFFLFFFITLAASYVLHKANSFLDFKFQDLLFAEKLDNKTLLETEIYMKKESKEFPFYLKAPKVSALLFWLQEHPIFGKKESGNALFELMDFHYELITLPTLLDPQKEYLVRIELTFFTPHSNWAKKFHDSLLVDSTYVHSKDFSWEMVSEGIYKTSFYFRSLTWQELYEFKNL